MDIHLTTRHLDQQRDHASALLELVQRRAGFAFARFEALVRAIDIRVCDVNGPRGGQDIACTGRLSLVDGGDLHVACQASSPESGIALAIARLSGRLRRQVSRRHEHR